MPNSYREKSHSIRRSIAVMVALCSVFSLRAVADPGDDDVKAQTAATSKPTTQQLLDEQRRNLLEVEAATLFLPRKRTDSLRKVFQLNRVGENLVPDFVARDIADRTRLMFVRGARGVLTVEPLTLHIPDALPSFNFNQIDFTVPGHMDQVEVLCTNAQLVMARTSGDTDERNQLSVQLIQDSASVIMDGDGLPVRAFIKRIVDNAPVVNLTYRARSFAALCSEHPAEMALYVRPMFRMLHQENAAFAPDPKLAFEVFAPMLPIDPKVTTSVNQLLVKLDADDFAERNAAIAKLTDMGQPAALALMRVDRSTMSEDKRNSIDTILAVSTPEDATAAAQLLEDKYFLLDCLELEDAALRTLAWKQLQSVTKTTATFDPSITDAPRRNATVQQLRDLITPTTSPTTSPSPGSQR